MSSSAAAAMTTTNAIIGSRSISRGGAGGDNSKMLRRRVVAPTRGGKATTRRGGGVVEARIGGIIDAAKVADVAGTAVVEVSKAVRMRGVEAPDTAKSYVAKGRASSRNPFFSLTRHFVLAKAPSHSVPHPITPVVRPPPPSYLSEAFSE